MPLIMRRKKEAKKDTMFEAKKTTEMSKYKAIKEISDFSLISKKLQSQWDSRPSLITNEREIIMRT